MKNSYLLAGGVVLVAAAVVSSGVLSEKKEEAPAAVPVVESTAAAAPEATPMSEEAKEAYEAKEAAEAKEAEEAKEGSKEEDFTEMKDEYPVFNLSITNHVFTPTLIEVPAGQKVKIVIKNNDAQPEEFDSPKLSREKMVAGGQEGVVYVGPLNAGDYEFVGEMNAATAKGVIRAK